MEDFIYGLAVVLIIFEGIIIRCEGAGGGEASSSSNQRKKERRIATKEEQILWPNEEMEKLVGMFESTNLENNLEYNLIMGKILQHHIINTSPLMDRNRPANVTIYESYEDGDLFLKFAGKQILESFLKRFDERVKKIYCKLNCYWTGHNELVDRIITKYAKSLEELRIDCSSETEYCEKILDRNMFPKVENLQLLGFQGKIKFKLRSKFPNLKSIGLPRDIHNYDCLADITGLEELVLSASLIKGKKPKRIFDNNNRSVKRIRLYYPESFKTMKWIAKYLTELKTLEVYSPDEHFLFEKDNLVNRVLGKNKLELKFVTHFQINHSYLTFKIFEHSFVMPSLRKLTFSSAIGIDEGIVNFINNFNPLNELEIYAEKYCDLRFITEFKNVKQLTTTFEGDEFSVVERLLKIIDENSKLEELKFVNNDRYNSEYPIFANFMEEFQKKPSEIMEEINRNLKGPSPRMWTYEMGTKTRPNYLMFKRGPCMDPEHANLA